MPLSQDLISTHVYPYGYVVDIYRYLTSITGRYRFKTYINRNGKTMTIRSHDRYDNAQKDSRNIVCIDMLGISRSAINPDNAHKMLSNIPTPTPMNICYCPDCKRYRGGIRVR